jgi:hypothetical protein
MRVFTIYEWQYQAKGAFAKTDALVSTNNIYIFIIFRISLIYRIVFWTEVWVEN